MGRSNPVRPAEPNSTRTHHDLTGIISMPSRSGDSISILRIIGFIVVGAAAAALAFADVRGLLWALLTRPSRRETRGDL